MSYRQHVGPGHTWQRATSTSTVFCQCGYVMHGFTSGLSLPRSQKGQLQAAELLDRLAQFGMFPHAPDTGDQQCWSFDTANSADADGN